MAELAFRDLVKALVCVAGLFAGACSSNGGSSPPIASPTPSPTPPPAPTPTPVNFNTAEYQRQPGLAEINALPAYDAGASGEGVIVSVIDTGIDENNSEFSGRIHPSSADLVISGVVAPGDVRPGGPSLQDEDDHGTPIASIIAANRDIFAIHGVAPEARLLIFRADDASDTETILGAALAEGVNRSVSIGAHVLNLSLGSDEPGARSDFEQIFTVTSANDIVSVIAAGNESGADPQLSAQGALDVAGAPSVIVVGALDMSSGLIASFSNRAGIASDIFLVAPGVLIPTVRVDTPVGQTDFFSGTSAAVPHVAGAAALIRDLWPALTASEVVDILLQSATDLGAPGTDSVYGHGLLNVGAAVQPIGAVTTTSVDGRVTGVDSIAGQLSTVFGSGFSDLGEIVVFDNFNRDFRVNLGGVIGASAPQQFDLEAVLSPFENRSFTVKRIGDRHSLRLQLSEKDRSAQEAQFNMIAPFSGASYDSAFVEDELSVALTSDLGDGRSLTFSHGFSPRAVDSMQIEGRQTPFLLNSAFSDPFLPRNADAMTALMQMRLSKSLTADFTAAYAGAREALLGFDDLTQGPLSFAATSAFRAGLNIDLPKARIRFEQGLRYEDGAILEATFDGRTSATTYYSAVDADWAFAPKWRFKARYAAGYTVARTDGVAGLVDAFSDLVSTQFSASFVREGMFRQSDALWLGVSQPLQLETGAAVITAPTEYDPLTRTIAYSTLRAPLGVQGRRYDLEAGYRLIRSGAGALDLNIVHQMFAEGETSDQTSVLLRGGFAF